MLLNICLIIFELGGGYHEPDHSKMYGNLVGGNYI
jgi:hypothetical protein